MVYRKLKNSDDLWNEVNNEKRLTIMQFVK